MSDIISISVNGKQYAGWTSASIKKSMGTLAGSFHLDVVDSTTQKLTDIWPLQTQDECIIRLGTDILITGFIETISSNIAPSEHTIAVSGRDKTADLIDCSAINKPGSFSKINILSLAQTLVKPFGINVKLQEGVNIGENFRFTINSSETPFEILDKKVKELGITLFTDNRGNLVLGNNTREETHDKLVYGENLKNARAIFDYKDRYSLYKVQTQSASVTSQSWGSKIGISGQAEDEGVFRYRPLLIRGESQMTNSFAKRRAQWEALSRAAKSQTIEVAVQGFRQSNGMLWEINKLVEILIPPCYVTPAIQMLVTDIEYKLDEEGSVTLMTLKREDAYISQPISKVKKVKNLGW